jgi:hypothetical protein
MLRGRKRACERCALAVEILVVFVQVKREIFVEVPSV